MEYNFSINPLMALCGIPLIPVAAWYFKQKSSLKTFIFGLFVLFTFSSGTIEILGIPKPLIRLLSESLVIILLIFSVMSNSKKKVFRIPGFYALTGFIVFSLISTAISNTSLSLLFLFYRDYIFVFLLFYAMLNLRFTDHEIKLLLKLALLCVSVQIAANFIKYLVSGSIIEPYVGSMAVLGGSLTIIFALTGSAYAIVMYLDSKNTKFLLLLLGFIAFSIIGGKRATVVYVPLLYLVLLIRHQITHNIKATIWFKQIMLFIIIFLAISYLSIRLMPSLNQEQIVWGTFNLDYALDYSERYVSTGAGAIDEIGRSAAPAYILKNTASDSFVNFFFGYGSGHLIKSSLNPLISEFSSQSEITKVLYGVGYGARTAFLQLFLQVGICGVFLYLCIWYKFFRFAQRNLSKYDHEKSKSAYLTLFGFSLVFLIDFFTYSMVVTNINSVTIILCIMFLITNYPKIACEVFTNSSKKNTPIS